MLNVIKNKYIYLHINLLCIIFKGKNTHEAMKTTLKRELNLKDGRTFPKGANFTVFPSEKFPDHKAQCLPPTGPAVFLQYPKLPLYFNDFHAITESELETTCLDGFCPSITGEDVEPDGHDSHGFPSWLIAMGFC